MHTLSTSEVEWALGCLPGWVRDGDRLVREYLFPDPSAAGAFIEQVAVLAERAHHHPDVTPGAHRVRITLTTHDAGGITERDVELAAAINSRAP